MKSIWLFVVSIILTAVISAPIASAKIGGSDGGGGSICYFEGQAILLDFIGHPLFPPQPGVRFPEDDPIQIERKLRASQYHSDQEFQKQITLHDNLQAFGYEEMALPERLKARINEILDLNRNKSPILVSILKKELIQFVATPFSFQAPIKADFESFHSDCNSENTRAVAMYLHGNTAFVDVARWNILDLDSQAGLYIHESLRLIQRYNRGVHFQNARWHDRELQKMVANLFFEHQSLDQSPVVQNFLESFPIRVPTDDFLSNVLPPYLSPVRESANISCRVAGRILEVTDEIPKFKARLLDMCEFYIMPHFPERIIEHYESLESDILKVPDSRRSSQLLEVLAEIHRNRLSLLPEVRRKFAYKQVMETSTNLPIMQDHAISLFSLINKETLSSWIQLKSARRAAGLPTMDNREVAIHIRAVKTACFLRETMKDIIDSRQVSAKQIKNIDSIYRWDRITLPTHPRCLPKHHLVPRTFW